MAACKGGGVSAKTFLSAIDSLGETLRHSEQARQKQSLLSDEIKEHRDTISRHLKQLDHLQTELRDLIQAGGAHDEEDFRQRAALYEK